jgi:serine/threonine protein kinase
MLNFPNFNQSNSVSDEFIKEYLADVRSKISKGEDFDAPLIKIVDFGLAREYEDEEEGLLETMCGTPLYIAPEIFAQNKYDYRVDIWSIGAIIYKLLFGKPPIKGKNLFEVKEYTLKGDYTIRKNIEISYDMIEIIYKCLRANPDERAMHHEMILAFSHSDLKNE